MTPISMVILSMRCGTRGTSTGQGGRGTKQNPLVVSMVLERKVRVSDWDMNGELGP